MHLLLNNLFLLSLFLLLPMAGHFTMELPAHLPECLFTLEFVTFLVKVLYLHSVIFLLRFVSEGFQLLVNRLFLVSS